MVKRIGGGGRNMNFGVRMRELTPSARAKKNASLQRDHDDKRARVAMKQLAIESRSRPKGGDNAGAKLGGYGAQLLENVDRSTLTQGALLGLSVMGLGGCGGPVMADTLLMQEREAARQAAQNVNAETGTFVQVRASNSALARTFAHAAAGEIDVSQLVISARPNDSVDVDQLRALKQQHPAAFEAVQDLHLVGVDLGGAASELFPNAKVVHLERPNKSAGPASSWLNAANPAPTTASMSPQSALIQAVQTANAAEQGPTFVSVPLSAGVGRGQPNREADVERVQQRLVDLGFNIAVDGDFGPGTLRAMRVYGAMVKNIDNAEAGPDRIRPNDDVHMWMQRSDSPRWQVMPDAGVGFRNADWDNHDFGSSTVADVIRETGKRYQSDYRAANPRASLIETNDVSIPRGGDTPDHATHEAGLDLDVRLPRTDGVSGTKVSHSNYDRGAARAMIQAFIEDPRVESVLIGDRTLLREFRESDDPNAAKVLDGGRGHRDHIHVDVRVPRPPPLGDIT